jgi:hypothetical protein
MFPDRDEGGATMALDITLVHVDRPGDVRATVRRRAWIVVAFGAAEVAFGLAEWALDHRAFVAVVFGAALFVLGLVLPWAVVRRLPPGAWQPQSIQLTDDHVQVTTELSLVRLRWRMITKVRRVRGRWLFYAGRGVVVAFNDAALTPDRAEELARFVEARGLSRMSDTTGTMAR